MSFTCIYHMDSWFLFVLPLHDIYIYIYIYTIYIYIIYIYTYHYIYIYILNISPVHISSMIWVGTHVSIFRVPILYKRKETICNDLCPVNPAIFLKRPMFTWAKRFVRAKFGPNAWKNDVGASHFMTLFGAHFRQRELKSRKRPGTMSFLLNWKFEARACFICLAWGCDTGFLTKWLEANTIYIYHYIYHYIYIYHNITYIYMLNYIYIVIHNIIIYIH